MTEIINAFNPAYVRTHMPSFMTDLRTQSRQTKNGQMMSSYVDKTRATKPSHGTVFGISKKVTSIQPMQMMNDQPKKGKK